ncbi:MAG: carbon starvation protein A [Planctomycetes bacterium]|nr:carbon starvation protein A [Planctomycetota bacterium]
MSAAVVAAVALLVYVVGYRVYGRWLAERVFRLDAHSVTPAHAQSDGVDFVPTRKLVLFGHHYASIAGLAPMLGPAVAVFWGWFPALCWVVLGSLLLGCVHDFSALVLSARHQGRSIGGLCDDILGERAKGLFLLLIFFGVSLAMGVFVYVLSLLFQWGDDFQPQKLSASTTSFPEVVFPSAALIVLAIGAGWLMYVRKKPLSWVAGLGFLCLLGFIGLGYQYPTMGFERSQWPGGPTWIWILMTYAYLASVLPVWLLLQARDFLNSMLLVLGLFLMYGGFFMQGPIFEAPAINPNPVGAPPILPFVFITIACGAVSGFHSLVASGTTARQLNSETDARPIGYGGMIAESLLGLIAVLACTTTLGGGEAWAKAYVNWQAVQGLGAKLGIFIRGAASFISEWGVDLDLAVTLVAMVVVSFALTTLDSATRLLRFNIEEIAGSSGRFGALFSNRFIATAAACGAILFFAFYEMDGKPAGLALWTLFGGTNQLIAGLALLTGAAYLRQRGRTHWPLTLPAVFMMANTAIALSLKASDFWRQQEWLLLALTAALMVIGVGVTLAVRSRWKELSA